MILKTLLECTLVWLVSSRHSPVNDEDCEWIEPLLSIVMIWPTNSLGMKLAKGKISVLISCTTYYDNTKVYIMKIYTKSSLEMLLNYIMGRERRGIVKSAQSSSQRGNNTSTSIASFFWNSWIDRLSGGMLNKIKKQGMLMTSSKPNNVPKQLNTLFSFWFARFEKSYGFRFVWWSCLRTFW